MAVREQSYTLVRLLIAVYKYKRACTGAGAQKTEESPYHDEGGKKARAGGREHGRYRGFRR